MANTKITSRVIADNAITTAAIADDAVTSAKLDTNIAIGGTLDVSGAFTSLGIDDNATSTAITIDSSKTVLVGKTAQNLATEGISINPLGYIQVTENQSPTLYLNRLNTDGSIINFYRDGTAVGSIGTFGGTTYYASNTHGFLINGTQIEPCNNTGGRLNNTVDIGSPTYKFKNLHLSGGVYLGGTAAANKLDDYEEGTWTPNITSGSEGITFDYVEGKYQKVGNMVWIHCGFHISAIASIQTYACKIYGLPYAGANYGSYQEPMGVAIGANFATSAIAQSGLSFFQVGGTSDLGARRLDGNSDTAITNNNVFQVGTHLKLQMVYYTA